MSNHNASYKDAATGRTTKYVLMTLDEANAFEALCAAVRATSADADALAYQLCCAINRADDVAEVTTA